MFMMERRFDAPINQTCLSDATDRLKILIGAEGRLRSFAGGNDNLFLWNSRRVAGRKQTRHGSRAVRGVVSRGGTPRHVAVLVQ